MGTSTAPHFLAHRRLPKGQPPVVEDAFVPEDVYVPPVTEVDKAPMPALRERADEVVDLTDFNPAYELDELTKKAFDAMRNVLDMDLPSVHHDHFPAVLNAKVKASSTIITAKVRVDENSLKARTSNKFGDMLEKLMGTKVIDGQARPLPAAAT